MNKIVAIALIFMLGFPDIYNFGLFVNYQTNFQEYVELCINAENKELKCNGKCHLTSSLLQTQQPVEEEKEAQLISNLLVYLISYFENTFSKNPSPFVYSALTVEYTFQFIHPIFHPPLSVLF